jgi:hypothetical protein
MYRPNIQVPTKQPQGSDEEHRLAIPQHQERFPQSTQEVASTLAIAMGLRRHSIPMRQCMNVLPYYQFLHHLEKRRKYE